MILIIAAVPLETSIISSKLNNCQSEHLGSTQIVLANIFQQKIILAHSGVGQPAMTLQLTRILEKYRVTAVLLCGCAGSYPGSPLRNGDVVIASEEIFGDAGVVTANHFIPTEKLDIPHVPDQMLICKERYTLVSQLTDFAQATLPDAHFGPCVTVSSCSGHDELSRSLEKRTKGLCENMEGAAAAQACDEYNVPLLEIRGISNPTGTRDPQLWDIDKGAEAAQKAILQLLANWSEEIDQCN